MNFRSLALRLATTAALATLSTGAFAQEVQRVAVKTDGLSSFVARSIEEKAALGIDELRRYVERTRMIHGLYIPDLVRQEDVAIGQAQAVPAEEVPVVAVRQAETATKTASAKSSKPQLAKNTKSASPVQVAGARQAAPAKVAAAKSPADPKLALAGQKTKRA